jgi:fatty-acyl-CoA synthase
MSRKHLEFWPKALPHEITSPATNLFYNVEVSATRFPTKPILIFYESAVTYAEFKEEVEKLAGYLQRECGVVQGDRVLLVMQNSPQFIIAYYAILRANAVVVPINPMSVTAELEHYVNDSGAKVALVAQEVFAQLKPLIGAGLKRVVVAAYADYVRQPTELRLPEVVSAPRQAIDEAGATCVRDRC